MIEPIVQLVVSLVWGSVLLFGFISNSGMFPAVLTAEEEKKLLEELKTGSQEARNLLVEKNLRLVAHIAKRYTAARCDQEDLVSIGVFGLIKAINTYDMDKNIRLATYASRCIENEILMYLRANKKSNNDVYLQEIIVSDKDGNDVSLIDLIGDGKASVEESTQILIQSEEVKKAIKTLLTKNERYIIECRYGLINERECTQMEIAKELGISRSYVSRIEKRALEKLRAALT